MSNQHSGKHNTGALWQRKIDDGDKKNAATLLLPSLWASHENSFFIKKKKIKKKKLAALSFPLGREWKQHTGGNLLLGAREVPGAEWRQTRQVLAVCFAHDLMHSWCFRPWKFWL